MPIILDLASSNVGKVATFATAATSRISLPMIPPRILRFLFSLEKLVRILAETMASFDNATSPTSNNLYGVAFGSNTFVVVGDNGTIAKSTDNGSSFDNATSPTGTDLLKVTFGNNNFVAMGNSGKIVRSTDNGSSFSTVTSRTSNHLIGVTFGNNTFVGVGFY